jgi:DNA-binding response OmpR family regulator/putative methionine-R-sulfoxide reductase with GAF domain
VVFGEVDISCLTLRERRIVALLAGQPRVVSRAELQRELEPGCSPRAVDAAITRIRRKIEREPRRPQLLLTAHGAGYRWHPGASRQGGGGGGGGGDAELRGTARRVLALPDRRVDLDTSQVVLTDRALPLTTLEATVLETLVGRRGSWTPAEDLHPDRVSLRSAKARVKGVVHRLRQKLEADPQHPTVVLSRRGLGYRLDNARLASRQDAVPAMTWGFLRYLAQRLGLEDCVLYRRHGQQLVQVAAAGPKAGKQQIVDPIALRLEQGIVGAAAASGEPLIICDTRHDRRYVPDAFPGRSELTVPIVAEGEVVGVFDSESSKPRAYGEQHLTQVQQAMDLLREGLGR